MDAQLLQNSTSTMAAPTKAAVSTVWVILSSPTNTNMAQPYTASLAIVSLASSDSVNFPCLMLTAIPQTASMSVTATTRNTINLCPAKYSTVNRTNAKNHPQRVCKIAINLTQRCVIICETIINILFYAQIYTHSCALARYLLCS